MIAPLLLALVAPAPSAATDQPAPPAFTAEQVAFYTEKVEPILKANCLECHGGEEVEGSLHLTSRAAILAGGDSGPAIDAEDFEYSPFVMAIHYDGYEMPPSGQLAAADVEVLTRWAKMGLPFPADRMESPHGAMRTHTKPPKVTEKTKSHWAFRPVVRPEVPAVEHAEWVTNPVDAFVLARLEEAGMQPAGPASRTELLRRVTYDLTGLPPTPAEVAAFVADDAPDAYEKVIDRLLASPHYGEKFGRFWLDLVRYAETNSYERDGAKPEVWRYRDYVIRSFNDDKPYDEFLRQQIAGDERPDAGRDDVIATGYYRLGLWDDEPADPEQALFDELDDVVRTTGQVFLGLTVDCARCHDHKLDPIPQADYYRMLAFFRGMRRYGERSHESVAEASLTPLTDERPDPDHLEKVMRHERRVERVSRTRDKLERLVRPLLTPVDKEDFAYPENRVGVMEKYVDKGLSAGQFREYQRLTRAAEQLEREKPATLDMALSVKEVGAEPPQTHILIRGNPHAEGKPVEPGFPQVLSPPQVSIPAAPEGAASSGRRSVLADWLASPDNPLTARVMANRVWQHFFHRGIVRSPNNFGLQGEAPTHPELLDWLADEFVAGGWRFKPLIRRMLLSSAYRMSSVAPDAVVAADPENKLLGRANPRRLTSEEVRDSVLAVNGRLNDEMFGPSIYTPIPKEVLAGQSRPGEGWGTSPPDQQARRSVYIHLKRSLVDPIIAAFDGADTDFSCPVRFSTTQPTQALSMINSEFMVRNATALADSLESAATGDAERVRLALARVLQRPPTDAEVARGVDLMASLETQDGVTPERALHVFCVVALNLNEFFYLD